MINAKRNLIILLIISFSLLYLIEKFLVINTSSSMPLGLYLVSHPANWQRNMIVLACLPPNIAPLALARRYVTYGTCHGTEPIIKQLIALPNDQVSVTHDTIMVNGISHRAPRLATDTGHRPLPTPTLTSGYWLLGQNLHSFDSRYFGPTPMLLAQLKPIVTWGST